MEKETMILLGAVLVALGVFLYFRGRNARQAQPPANNFEPYYPEPVSEDPDMGTVPLMPVQESDACFAPSSQQPQRNFTVTAIGGPLKGSSWSLVSRDLFIGRSPECQIRFSPDTPGVSGKHCLVTLTPAGEVILTDVGSTYGTYLGNGQRLAVNQGYKLFSGSTFLLAGLDGPAFLVEEM